MSSVIQFPSRQLSTNHFTPAHMADLAWFEREAATMGLRLQADLDATTGERTWIAINQEGGQFVTIEHHFSNGGLFMVAPAEGAWRVSEAPFLEYDTGDFYGTLRDALRAILTAE